MSKKVQGIINSVENDPPMTSDLEVLSPVSSVLKIGCRREKQRAGAATLEIHMLANMATNMEANSTWLGFCPTFSRTQVAIALAM